MKRLAPFVLGCGLSLLPAVLVVVWVSSAHSRLVASEAPGKEGLPDVAIAAQADETYCTPALKKILRRVLQSCGLIHGRSGRGCKPMDAKSVATMGGDDFNELFIPMRGRGGIIEFDKSSAELEQTDRALIAKLYAERRGASYFFVVARASPEGSVALNRRLSQQRAEAVLAHLKQQFDDTELDQQVGLLWLGEEFAQLDRSFCQWTRSNTAGECRTEDLNRSAFITWIDCQL
ncbi:MAG: hypothetical protein V1750_07250 [Acidobacteriota bacterium]